MTSVITPDALYLSFKEYLKVWLNIILKERELYPATSFEDRNSFDLRVPINRHPEVLKWQDDLIENLVSDVDKIRLVSLVILDDTGDEEVIKERYSIDLKEFLHPKRELRHKPISGFPSLTWNDIYNEFRASLYSLLSTVRRIDKDDKTKHRSFTVLLETQEHQMNADWVLESSIDIFSSEDIEITSTNKEEFESAATKLLPLRTVDLGPIIFYSYIEIPL